MKLLVEKQKKELDDKTNVKYLHGRLVEAKRSPHVDIGESTTWLRHGNNSPQDEAVMCYLQDRNVFFGESRGTCTYCKEGRDP